LLCRRCHRRPHCSCQALTSISTSFVVVVLVIIISIIIIVIVIVPIIIVIVGACFSPSALAMPLM
jgi:hypothetical protein